MPKGKTKEVAKGKSATTRPKVKAVRARSTTKRPEAKARTSDRSASKRPSSLLFLHLNANQLRADGLHLERVATFTGVLVSLGLGSHVAIEDVVAPGDLDRLVAGFARAGRRFDVVVAIGHSNPDGIRIDPPTFVSWADFARRIKPIKPRRLLLVACKGGLAASGDAFFAEMRDLRRIYACPVNASKDFGQLMLAAVPFVVAERAPSGEHVTWAQLGAIALTGRQLREWRRTTDMGNPLNVVHDVVAQGLDPIARQVPGIVRRLLGG